jgi:hypothetical protein
MVRERARHCALTFPVAELNVIKIVVATAALIAAASFAEDQSLTRSLRPRSLTH